jgi:hypothetical protein
LEKALPFLETGVHDKDAVEERFFAAAVPPRLS